MRTGLAILVALVLLPGCDDGILPPIPAATWALATVDGVPLPVTLPGRQITALRLLADTLVFTGAGDFRRVRLFDQGVAGDVARSEVSGTVVAANGARILSVVCGPAALCVPPDTVRVRGSTLHVTSLLPPGGELVFVRQ